MSRNNIRAVLNNKPLLYLLLGRFMVSVGFGLYTPTLPIYLMELGGTLTMVGVAMSIYQLPMMTLQTFFGRLADKYGRKSLFAIGVFIHALGSFLCTQAKTPMMLLGFRAVMGFGSSVSTPANLALLADLVPEEQRGTLIGGYNTVVMLGWFGSPILGGFLADMYGLKFPFYACALAEIIALLPILFKIQEPPREKRKVTEQRGRWWNFGGATKMIMILSFVIFLRSVGGSLINPLMRVYMVTMGATMFQLGLVQSAFGLTASLLQAPIGALSDKYGRKIFLFIAYLSSTVIYPLYIFASTIWHLIGMRVVHGIAGGIGGPTATAMAIDLSPKDRRGITLGVTQSAMSAGSFFGPLMGGVLADMYGLQVPFMVCTVLSAVGTVGIFFFLKDTVKRAV